MAGQRTSDDIPADVDTARFLSPEQLRSAGMTAGSAGHLADAVNGRLSSGMTAEQCWRELSQTILAPEMPFAVHKLVYETVYARWDRSHGPPPAWFPSDEVVRASNLHALMQELQLGSYEEFFSWSVNSRPQFWDRMIRRLDIRFDRPYSAVVDLSDLEQPSWLEGARLNIVSSCFQAPEQSTALIHQAEGSGLTRMTYGELHALTNRVANGLRAAGFEPGDAIAVDLPMSAESVAIYLGIITAGCTAVSIADSFAAEQIRVRLKIAEARGIFTQNTVRRGGRVLPLYEKVLEAGAPRAVVLDRGPGKVMLRAGDIGWDAFLSDDASFTAVSCEPDDPTNILFSSGTTGEPKAIPWTHTTPIKCGVDAHLHHDIQPGNVLAWPTSLGWMMGPWLIYASLLNRATIALFEGSPTGREFGEFVRDAGVTMLGVVPSLVRAWKNSGCMSGLDWRRIRAFSSTGEPADAQDMLYLMGLAGYRPVIDYCGGTEIGGVYVACTMLQPCAPTVLTTPSPGIDFMILDEEGRPADRGEVFLIPPSIGLSTRLLNQDHHQVYYEGTPRPLAGVPLRRHGDYIERLTGRGAGGTGYRIHGRVDDTMNLGGIKVSSAEIERQLNTLGAVTEAAAISVVPPGGGPGRLVIYAALETGQDIPAGELKRRFQAVIAQRLNPLFRVHDVVIVESLPRTASNKIMRRALRERYEQEGSRQ